MVICDFFWLPDSRAQLRRQVPRGFSPLVPTIIMKRNKTYTLAIYFDEMIKQMDQWKVKDFLFRSSVLQNTMAMLAYRLGQLSPRQRNGISMAFRWRGDSGPIWDAILVKTICLLSVTRKSIFILAKHSKAWAICLVCLMSVRWIYYIDVFVLHVTINRKVNVKHKLLCATAVARAWVLQANQWLSSTYPPATKPQHKVLKLVLISTKTNS